MGRRHSGVLSSVLFVSPYLSRMTTLPISICLFTSTKGHYDVKTIYLDTLNHLNRQIPLSQFGSLYAHIKVTPGEEQIGADMARELNGRGFIVDQTVGAWNRGTSHQQAYLADMNTASQARPIHYNPYMLLLEDDSPFECHQQDLVACLHRMVSFLDGNQDIVSTRFIRAGDWAGGVPVIHAEKDYFYSPNCDFQPMILRTRDYFIANKIIQDNWASIGHLQCELIMRLALDQLSRSDCRHVVWLPEYGETYHLGTPDYLKTKAAIGL